ncbi:MAG: SpoIIE family protein phosphatase [Spirochaetales bacterium]|nr:SpoIIE family protein phosphatase [Leptospiraceae bacterium]MCP5479831.1 SpoIIE family protein phosphatase [Spirochaetales bacterium]MCP5486221.1 SpoIIE family protein phosphatase [Spirochaetales bacterium]
MSQRNTWELTPIPHLLINEQCILRANPAFLALVDYEAEEIVDKSNWMDLVMAPEQKPRFTRAVFDSRRPQADVQLRSRNGQVFYVRLERRQLHSGEMLVALMDLTTLTEDNQVLQAGYDEFVKVTIELEEALATIEKQNALLEKQRNILRNELSIAHTVQSQLYAQDFSRFRFVRAAGFYQAMDELGGDMWEFHEGNHEFVGVIGDVMGHGVAASLISIAARTLFKTNFEDTHRAERGLGVICGGINRELIEITRGNYYVTICLLRIDRHYKMEYVTCGHPPIFVVRADSGKQGEQLFTPQPMLGIFPKEDYVSESIQLEPGDRVLMYTDCLLETFNERGDALELDKITQLVRYRDGTTPASVVKDLLDYIYKFGGTKDLSDDLALVCIEVPGKTGQPRDASEAPVSETKTA